MNYSGSNQRWVISGIFTVILFIFLLRLFYIQLVNESYKLSAHNNVLRYVTEYPARGLVYDKKGRLLTFNEAVYDLMVTPRQVKIMDTAEFCRLIDISKEHFEKKLSKAKQYSLVKSSIFEKQLSAETYAALQEKLYKYNGFFVQPRTLRRYPYKIAAHTLGYIGEVNENLISKNPYYQLGDYIGISGIEQSYEKELRGKRGLRIVMVDVFNREKGRFEDGKYDSAAIAGTHLISSLDAELQLYAEKLFVNKTGSLVAIEPATGELLAMVSNPSYDPNLLVGRVRSKNYSSLLQDSMKPLFNRAMQAYYPPGSTFKLVNALIAQQEKIISSDTRFPCSFSVGGRYIRCHPHPSPADLHRAVQYSCNPYFCHTFRTFIDHKKFYTSGNGYRIWREHVLSFGIGIKLGVDMPHELKGMVPSVEFYDKQYGKGHWKASNIYSLGIGQGELGITPLQMANIMCIIANKGFFYIPHVIKSIGDSGRINPEYTKKNFTKIEPQYFEVITNGMLDVVEAGTARASRINNIRICGKTGTAQNPHGKDHSLFVGFAPMDNPKIAIAVMVENAGFGGTWAAPIASLVIEKYLTDSISRPHIEENMLKGNLLPASLKLKNDSVMKEEAGAIAGIKISDN